MTHRSSFVLILGALGASLALAGCPSDPEPADAGGETDTGAVDTGPAVDTGRDTGGSGTNALDNQRAAAGAFITPACHCIAMAGAVTEAECITNSSDRDAAFDACEREAFNATATAMSAYYNCLADAINADAACYSASDCSDAATMACDDTATMARTDCQDLITDAAARTTFVNTNDACIQRTVIGDSTGSCLETTAISTGVGPAVFSGDTTLGGNHTEPNPSCVGRSSDANGAADHAYQWQATEAGLYRFDTVDSAFDTVLYVRETCTTMELGCNDDIESGVIQDSDLTLMLAAGQVVSVIVDGFGETQRGAYVVNITYLGAGDGGGMMDAGMTDAGAADAGMTDAGVSVDAPVTPLVETVTCPATPDAEITTSGLTFSPAATTIAAGQIIRFTPVGAHDMTSGTAGVADGTFATTTSVVECLRFNVAGAYPYFCSVHGASMSGTVTVTP